MTFHPFAGLFSPGEGPVLRGDAEDGCAYEHSGRWRSTRCRAGEVTHLAFDPLAYDDDGDLLCAPHAAVWRGTPAVADGQLAVLPLDSLEG